MSSPDFVGKMRLPLGGHADAGPSLATQGGLLFFAVMQGSFRAWCEITGINHALMA